MKNPSQPPRAVLYVAAAPGYSTGLLPGERGWVVVDNVNVDGSIREVPTAGPYPTERQAQSALARGVVDRAPSTAGERAPREPRRKQSTSQPRSIP